MPANFEYNLRFSELITGSLQNKTQFYRYFITYFAIQGEDASNNQIS